MATQQQVLEVLVAALGETREQVAEAYTAEKFRTGDPVARFVDRFLCEGQEAGVLEADAYVGSDAWNDALDVMFGEDLDDDEEES